MLTLLNRTLVIPVDIGNLLHCDTPQWSRITYILNKPSVQRIKENKVKYEEHFCYRQCKILRFSAKYNRLYRFESVNISTHT